jgi:hypothetical protein
MQGLGNKAIRTGEGGIRISDPGKAGELLDLALGDEGRRVIFFCSSDWRCSGDQTEAGGRVEKGQRLHHGDRGRAGGAPEVCRDGDLQYYRSRR